MDSMVIMYIENSLILSDLIRIKENMIVKKIYLKISYENLFRIASNFS